MGIQLWELNYDCGCGGLVDVCVALYRSILFGYGIIEHAIQKHRVSRRDPEPQHLLAPLEQPQPVTRPELRPKTVVMIVLSFFDRTH